MDTTEKQVLESRAERIARYKAERRRELAERFGDLEEVPSKWVRRDGKELNDPETPAYSGGARPDGCGERLNGGTQEVLNGVEANTPVDHAYLRR